MENESWDCSLNSRELGCCASLWILQSMALYYIYIERAPPLCILLCASCAFSENRIAGLGGGPPLDDGRGRWNTEVVQPNCGIILML